MRVLTLLSACALFTLLQSCTAFYFRQPQPSDAKDLAQCPRELRGEYYGVSVFPKKGEKPGDSLLLSIGEKEITYIARQGKVFPVSDTAMMSYWKKQAAKPRKYKKPKLGREYKEYFAVQRGDSLYTCKDEGMILHITKDFKLRMSGTHYCINMRDTIRSGEKTPVWVPILLSPESGGALGLRIPSLSGHRPPHDSLRTRREDIPSMEGMEGQELSTPYGIPRDSLMSETTALRYFSRITPFVPDPAQQQVEDESGESEPSYFLLDPKPAEWDALIEKGFFLKTAIFRKK